MRVHRRYWLGFALSMALVSGTSGCVWKGEGLVRSGPMGAHLDVSTGQSWRLVLGEEQRALAHMDGQIAVIEGRRMFKNLSVKKFTVPSGKHGMAVWFGKLERRGVQLGLQDRNNGGFYMLSPDVWDDMADYVGGDVLVEGYVDGPHRIRVMYHQPLF